MKAAVVVLLAVLASAALGATEVLDIKNLDGKRGVLLYGSPPDRSCGSGLEHLSSFTAAGHHDLAVKSFGARTFVISSRPMPWPASVSLQDVATTGVGIEFALITTLNMTMTRSVSAGDVNADVCVFLSSPLFRNSSPCLLYTHTCNHYRDGKTF